MAIVCNESGLINLDKATPTNFMLVFPKIPTEETISASNPLVLNIFSTVIPGVSIGEEEHGWQANRTKRAQPPLIYDQWMINFVVDSLFENWKILFTWISFLNNNYDKHAEDHDNYSIDASLVGMDNYRNSILELRFIDIWPISIGEVSFSQREGDVQIECTANFNYDYFLVHGE